MRLDHIFTYILLFTTLVLGAIGGFDDYLKLKYKNAKGMSARGKLTGQLLLSILIASYFLLPPVQQKIAEWTGLHPPIVKEQIQSKEKEEKDSGSVHGHALSLREYISRIYFPFFKEPVVQFTTVVGGVCVAFFIFFVIAGSSNAVNLTDGLDGLAAGCLILVAASLGLIAFVSNHIEFARFLNILYIEGSGEIAIYLCAMIGACLGFLWYNGYPAQVFMGDTGSLPLGGVIGVSAVLLKREFLLGIIGGIFVAEALSVILQVGSYKFRNKKRIFLCAPLHHHFEYMGWPETKVVIRFWIIGLLLAIIGVASLKFQ
jgi:phospho-N-acetylmuramoyl-pentapeptide-transferase